MSSAAACATPATRTSKNSSRLLALIARNFTRSRRGFFGSRASSRTRPLKSSQESSRFVKASDGYRGAEAGMAGWVRSRRERSASRDFERATRRGDDLVEIRLSQVALRPSEFHPPSHTDLVLDPLDV